jgi:tyrosine-protein kinase Src
MEFLSDAGARFPVKWTAPEAIIYNRFTIKSDVWSYGILLMEIFTYGQVPYPGMNTRDVIEALERGYRMPKPTSMPLPDEIYNVMLLCWDNTPEKRPTFEFLQHFFEDFNVTSEIPYREI